VSGVLDEKGRRPVPDESGAVIDQRVRRDRDHAAKVPRRHRDDALEEVGEDPDPRFTFANERTLLAWNRTALALIAAGVGASQLLELGSRALSLILAVPLIALGCAIAIASYGHWEANERAMRLGLPLTRPPYARVLRLTIALVGVAAIVLGIIDAAA
jgi:putative membrane protein